MDFTPSTMPQEADACSSSGTVCSYATKQWGPLPSSLEANVKASMMYRISAVFLLLLATGHLLGFRQSDPTWGVDGLLASMRSIHFNVQGFDRTYWDLFEAAGFCVGILYIFAAILAWQLGSLPPASLTLLRGTSWAFALCFAAITIVSWKFLFVLPIAFSVVITLCLTVAAWLSAQQASTQPR